MIHNYKCLKKTGVEKLQQELKWRNFPQQQCYGGRKNAFTIYSQQLESNNIALKEWLIPP